MPTWLVLGLMAIWAAICISVLWQHSKGGLVFYGVLAAILIAVTFRVF